MPSEIDFAEMFARVHCLAMRFAVSFRGKRRFVDLVFGKPMDIKMLMRWRASVTGRTDPHVLDALEFRKLATKRWRYYVKGNEAARSIRELKQAIRENPEAEVGFLLMAKAPWHTAAPIVGCCFCRRTWCHHLVVDFLAVHPKVLAASDQRLRGVGSGIVYSLVGIADDLGVPTIWGEATKNSAAFYQKILNLREVSDHFFLRGVTMNYCRQQFRRIQQR